MIISRRIWRKSKSFKKRGNLRIYFFWPVEIPGSIIPSAIWYGSSTFFQPSKNANVQFQIFFLPTLKRQKSQLFRPYIAFFCYKFSFDKFKKQKCFDKFQLVEGATLFLTWNFVFTWHFYFDFFLIFFVCTLYFVVFCIKRND